MEKMHPFDSTKYGRIFKSLQKKNTITSDVKFYRPAICERVYLQEVVGVLHLFLLNYSLYMYK
jgi:histone deacetylase 11